MIDALDYTLIHDSKAMVSAIKDLSAFPSLAIDLEMENYCHRPGLYLSLIQISTSDKRISSSPTIADTSSIIY